MKTQAMNVNGAVLTDRMTEVICAWQKTSKALGNEIQEHIDGLCAIQDKLTYEMFSENGSNSYFDYEGHISTLVNLKRQLQAFRKEDEV